jgi:hypothetical protein
VFRPLWVAVYTAVATAPRERFPALAAGVGGCWWRWWRSGSDRARRERAAQAGQRRADKERLRVARELHDVVSHSIAMINFRAGVALHVIDRRPEEAKAALVAIRQGSAGAMQELRAALGVLRHPGGSPRTPGPGLGQLAELVEGVAGAGRAVEIVAEGDPGELPPAVDLAAYRAVQESLTNVVKHAGPAPAAEPGDGEAAPVIRILVADDQALFRAGLRVLLEATDDLELVGEAADGRTALELAGASCPTWSSWTCACPAWTASRRPGRSPPTRAWPGSGW